MTKNILQSIDNVAIWPVISFMIFFLFFIILIWYVITVDKSFIHYMKGLPVDEGTDNKTFNQDETQHP
ncbi:MAG: cbb3-type cytochrome c oxidase subunit 3 [Bacteroidota bacterium]|jgi:cytochrome c oxidase cbb3-type subunit 4|nr:MAG: CcoQ/FixQ family Cbb3-type cytochrome c oxidase assembly chaperone [Bacteroidota bacterium]